MSPYLTKAEHEFEFTFLARIIENFLFRYYASEYEKFEQKVQHDPNRHIYEDEKYFNK